MATKKASAARQLETYKKQYKKICNGLKTFYIVALALLVVGLILYFVPWAHNYNANEDVEAYEQSPLGWTYIIATLSNTFSTLRGETSDTILFYFNLSYPFYSHAPGYTVALGVVTVLSLVALICSAVFYSIALFAKKPKFIYGALAAQIVMSIMLLAAMIIALMYNNSGIYYAEKSAYIVDNERKRFCDPDYCTMYTMIYIPFIVSLIGVAVSVITTIRYSQAGKLLRKIKSKERAIEKAKAKEAAEKAAN